VRSTRASRVCWPKPTRGASAIATSNDLESNRLHLHRGPTGANLSGTLVGEHALTSETAIERVADELFRKFTRDHDLDASIAVPSRATLRALVFAELCRRGIACDLESSRPPVSEAVLVMTPDDPYDSARDLDGARMSDAVTRTLRCGHHMPEWEAGGATDVARMALLCRRHHGIAHRDGWTSGIDDGGWTWFRTPAGHRLDGQRHGRAREGPDVKVA
jgi:hypothetical protein